MKKKQRRGINIGCREKEWKDGNGKVGFET